MGADKAILSPDKPDKPCCSQHNILSFQASYKPLLKQVVEEIFDPERPDPVDIEHMSSGLTDLLKTGFSMFMKVKLPQRGHPEWNAIFAGMKMLAPPSPVGYHIRYRTVF